MAPEWPLPQIGQHKELAPAVGPARGFGNGPRTSPRRVQFAKPGPRVRPLAGPRTGAGVGLQDTGPARKMPARMLAAAAARIEKHGGRRIAAAKGPVISDIEPALAKAAVHSRPVTALFLASTGTVASSPWIRSAAGAE